MSETVAETSGVALPQDVGGNAYQMSMAGMVLPLPIHGVFNAIAAASVLLLGHPAAAAAMFAGCCAFDVLYQSTLRRWRADSGGVDEIVGLRRLALLSAARVVTYIAVPTSLAMAGGPSEILLFGLTTSAFVAMACASGSLSRLVFVSLAGPLAPAVLLVAFSRLPLASAAGVALTLLSLGILLALISTVTTKALGVWYDAFNTNLALIPQLEHARDRAIAERAAADEAREEARRANRAKSNFLATMSHEIRTPMNGVLGMAQLLKRDETDPAQARRLDTLIESGEYLLSILNDILDVSKVDAGRLEISPHVEDLPLFLDRLVAFWSARAEENSVELRLQTDEELPHFIWMDQVRVRQVLFNLVGNALKFTEQGSITVSATARPHGENAVWLHVSVADTGPGIPADQLPKLFERFSQLDDSEERKFGGTGLGLAIAKQLTELMGGRVWAESEWGRGSTFHVEAPFDLAQAPDVTSEGAVDQGDATTLGPLDLLIVDDNPVNLMVLEQVLLAFGHRIEKAADGQAALDLLAQRPFDVAILDIQMPGMTGVEVLERLRAVPGPNQQAPVVALTADVVSGGRPHYLAMGFDEHSSKPIQIPDLMAAVGRASAGRSGGSRAARVA